MPNPIFGQIIFFYSYLFNILNSRIDLYYNHPNLPDYPTAWPGGRHSQAGILVDLPDKFYGVDVTSIEDQA
ncbi:MAG: hypothetical protein JYX80_11880 [Candidatus Scalindua sediminis]|nr:hypothetical protein [Candidatus Scalindua sediminis]